MRGRLPREDQTLGWKTSLSLMREMYFPPRISTGEQTMTNPKTGYEVTETLLPSEAEVVTYDDLIEDQAEAIAKLLQKGEL